MGVFEHPEHRWIDATALFPPLLLLDMHSLAVVMIHVQNVVICRLKNDKNYGL